ncbi:MAG: hypothetical protein LBS80_06105 [Tannerella sp.]|jgi:hypothetical protein|nr:hypothetical protein [Tannerella sp.]
MKYQMELDIDDNKISFAEEFFKSISFVRNVRTITSGTQPYEFIPEKSAEEIIAKIREHRSSGYADATPAKMKLSDKYRGMLSKEQGQSLQAHIHQMRNEWNAI